MKQDEYDYEWLGIADPEQAQILADLETEYELDHLDFDNLNDIDSDELMIPDSGLEFEISPDRRSRTYVKWVQRSLNSIMGAKLSVDGILGPMTRGSVKAFQRMAGLSVDGIVGPNTERALIQAGASNLPDSDDDSGGAFSPSERACPAPAKRATDRCTQPGSLTCPPIPNLVCTNNIDGIPFEYPTKIARHPESGLYVISRRQHTRTQRFTRSVKGALSEFLRNMSRCAMPVEAIITAGSLYCRCISNTNRLSNHSFGDAIDIVGVRWSAVGGPASQLRETIVHNYRDPVQRALLRRMNACLRLSFSTVIDYNYNRAHRDHFHVDMNRGRGWNPRGRTTLVFVQEALSDALQRSIPISGKLDSATLRALSEFSGQNVSGSISSQALRAILTELFTQIARGD